MVNSAKEKKLDKIESDSPHQCWWKMDCCLSQMCGVVVRYFKLPVIDHPLDKTRLTKTVKSEEGKKRAGGQKGRKELHVLCPHSPNFSPI